VLRSSVQLVTLAMVGSVLVVNRVVSVFVTSTLLVNVVVMV